MKKSELRQLIREEIKSVMNETYSYDQWSDAIYNFIIDEISSDDKELNLVIKALEKTLERFKDEMGGYDPDFHYDEDDDDEVK